MTPARGPVVRTGATLSALGYGVVIGATGMLPPRLRYGYVRRITRVLLQRQLPSLRPPDPDPRPGASTVAQVAQPGNLTCVLGSGALDVGGIGAIVELLAARLPAVGIVPVVICLGDGTRAQRLRDLGFAVHPVSDRASALRAIEEIDPDVIQLHGAPAFLESAAVQSGTPLVPVLHNTEIHYSRARWDRFSRLVERSASAIAVSELVRAFHAAHLPTPLRTRIEVVPNATPGRHTPDADQRQDARDRLERAVGSPLNDDVVFVCLARYDAQKNIAGTVASFLACVSQGVPARLVIAGEPSDWVEFRRADAIVRSSRAAERVHLLATSDAGTLLAAADAFVLNSFFEGWPVAATEAWAAGLPLILSDVGGARELIARDPAGSALIANAVGGASAVTDARVERARWRARRQRNSSEFGAAIRRIADTVRRGQVVSPTPCDAPDDVAAMIDAHARVLREAARRDRTDDSVEPGRYTGDETRGVVRT